MRVLGIETSSRRGSVALIDAGHVVARRAHTDLNAHAERLGALLDAALEAAGWTKRDIERIGVGMGPGSFTGLRVGIAYAQGISLGLGVPVVGVGSLEAMVRPLGQDVPGLRVPLLDARRGEVFAAAYDSHGQERLPPRALARESALSVLRAELGEGLLFLGEVATELGAAPHPDELSALPDAVGAALLASQRGVAESIDEPLYVRDAGATPQALPPSPFAR